MDIIDKNPLVTIGVPVFNESNFLEAALDCLVSQTYLNIEIILSDNCSTDETESIGLRYAEKYNFVRYHRFDENIGASSNFRYVLQEAKGQYFMWASGHDLWAEDYVHRCVSLLETNVDAVLAYGSVRWIDGEGEYISRGSGGADTRGMDAIARYFTVLWGSMNPVLGVIRTDRLRECKIEDMVGLDLAILLKLSLQGGFVFLTDASWSRRDFRGGEVYAEKLKRYRSSKYGLDKSLLAKIFPLAKLPVVLFENVLSSRLSWGYKALISFLLIPTFLVRYVVGKYLS